MKKNARYEGGSGTGVDLLVPLEDGQQRRVHVDQGQELPADFAGVAVDPEFVDRLLETDDWTTPSETSEQRQERLAEEKEQLEREEAAAAARAEHEAAADKAAAAIAKAEKAFGEHIAAGDQAAAAATERVRAEQTIRRAEQTIRETTKGGTS